MARTDRLLQRNLFAATVERARVLDVDTANYVLTVVTEYTQKPLTWVSYASPYLHHANGEGIYFVPEVGSICWLITPSDGGMPFVVAWTTIEDPGFRANRLDLNPGDIYFGTRDENHILLRRGGVVEIGATPLAQRLYLPVDNIIRDICANYFLQTLGGQLSWTVSIPEKNSSGRPETTLVLQAREFADDAGPVLEATIGSHGEGSPTILTLAVRESGSDGAAVNIGLTIDKTGDIKLTSEKDITWSVTGTVQVEAENITLHARTEAALVGDRTANVRGGVVNVKSTTGVVAVDAHGGMTVSSPGSPALKVGTARAPTMLATPDTLRWMLGHVHLCTAPGQRSGPPLDPATQLPIDSVQLQSKDLKAS